MRLLHRQYIGRPDLQVRRQEGGRNAAFTPLQSWAAMMLDSRAAPPFMKNGFVLGCETTRAGIIVDPGDEVEALLDLVAAHRLDVRYILLTHAHLDHITGVSRAKSAVGAPVGLHPDDKPLYDAVSEQGMMFGLRIESQPEPDFYYTPGQVIPFGNYEVDRAPHAGALARWGVPAGGARRRRPVSRSSSATRSLPVRSDAPICQAATSTCSCRSIRHVLFAFGDDALVYSGHGEATTIGRERRSNPFLA